MLNMVTRDFYNSSRVALCLFQAIGLEWDSMSTWSKSLNLEIFPQTCTWSISIWEWLHEIETDESLSLEVRRNQIMQRVLYQAPISPQSMRALILLCSGADDVLVEDLVAPYTFSVTVISTEEIKNMVEIWKLIYRVKPSHLRFTLYFQREIAVEHELHTGLHLGLHRQLTELPEEAWTEEETLALMARSYQEAQEKAKHEKENKGFTYTKKEMRAILAEKTRLRKRKLRSQGEKIEITFEDVLKEKGDGDGL